LENYRVRRRKIGVKKIAVFRLIGLLSVTVIAIGVTAGCSSNVAQKSTSTSPDQTSTKTGSTTLPRYEPSSVVSDTTGSLQFTSPDSVQKVTAFYDNALAEGGWSIISSSKTEYNTSVTAKKGNTGTSLSISATGGGTYISLTTYPM
jgi:hypothetical protein